MILYPGCLDNCFICAKEKGLQWCVHVCEVPLQHQFVLFSAQSQTPESSFQILSR